MLALVLALTASQLFPTEEKPRILDVCRWNEAAGPLAQILDRANHVEVFRLGEERWVPFVNGKTRQVVREGDADLFGRTTLGGRERFWAAKPLGIAHFPVVRADPTPPPALLPELLGVLRSGIFLRVIHRYADGGVGASMKLCGPLEPVIGYRFQTPDGFVELLICFRCQQARLYFRGENVVLHIDTVWRELLAVALSSFPFDPVLNALERETEDFNAATVFDFGD